jgi:hypothetical protein
MKARMDDSSFQAVAVQNVRFASLREIVSRFPAARRAWRVEIKA